LASVTLDAVRTVAELRDVADPAWPQLASAIDAAPNATVAPLTRADGEACLLALQVTARSALGALALNAGGVLVDQGWLRILGGGYEELPSLATANGFSAGPPATPPPTLLVAFDVLGGRFAVDGGGLGAPGEVHYWGPDTLAWSPLGLGHSDVVFWALGPGVAEFYADLRWDGWADEVSGVGLGRGLAVMPPLCTAQSRPVATTSRRPVPWAELSAFLDELSTLPDGEFRLGFGK
jgi:hypothetical protein